NEPACGRTLVLVVEDNADGAESLRLLFRYSGYDVRVASNGLEGVQIAFARLPDVVVCDLGLPGLDGYGVAKALRGHAETAGSWFIALTGYGDDSSRKKALECGFDVFLTKPADPEELLRVVEQGGT